MAGINHSVTKTAGQKGYASDWNADHEITGDVPFANNKITGLKPGTASTDAVNLSQVIPTPIGTVLSWLKSFTNTPALPINYIECNGQVLSDADSVYNGQTIPNLNGNNNFLRGNSTSGGTGGASSHSHTLNVSKSTNVQTAATAFYPVSDVSVLAMTGQTIPPYYEVVWIMRIK